MKTVSVEALETLREKLKALNGALEEVRAAHAALRAEHAAVQAEHLGFCKEVSKVERRRRNEARAREISEQLLRRLT